MKAGTAELINTATGKTRWFGDTEAGVLVDLFSGQVLATFEHDGHGKWEIVLFVSFWRALWILGSTPSGLLSVRPFPRCALWVFRGKSCERAMEAAEYFVSSKFWKW